MTSSLPPVPAETVYGSRSRPEGGSDYGYNNGSRYDQTARATHSDRTVERVALPVAQAPRGPAAREITIKRGDTLSSLSREHGVPIAAIKSANNMTSTYLQDGQSILIPDSQGGSRPGVVRHRVQRGESLAMIARQYGTTHSALASTNGLTNPDSLQPGDVIEVRQGTGQLAYNDNRSSRGVPIALPRIKKTRVKPVRVASRSPIVSVPRSKPASMPLPRRKASARKPKRQRVASIGKLPKPQPMSASSFRWPVRGRVVSSYGPKANGKHNDGINIAVPQGTSIKAAENGVVAYAGNELKGYGNLILVRHDGNWVSAYAHNSKLMVKRGDKIRRGQIIAKAGKSGSVGKPQLHFELRKGSRPVNPLRHMAGT